MTGMDDRIWTLIAQPTVETVAEGLAVIGSRGLPRWTRVLGEVHNFAFTLIYAGGAAALMLWALDRLGPITPTLELPLVLLAGSVGYLGLRWTRCATWRAVARRSLWPDPDRWTLPAQGLHVEKRGPQRQLSLGGGGRGPAGAAGDQLSGGRHRADPAPRRAGG